MTRKRAMRPVMRPVIHWGGAALALLMLSACANAGKVPASGAAEAPAVRQGEAYVTVAAYFADLQQAALGADYQGFAETLGAVEPAAIVADLQGAFGGGPFDIYTIETGTGEAAHRRVAALRSASGRLYLYYRLDRAADGWHIADHELGTAEKAALARL